MVSTLDTLCRLKSAGTYKTDQRGQRPNDGPLPSGTLSTTPPSIRKRCRKGTGSKIPGMVALARAAKARFLPEARFLLRSGYPWPDRRIPFSDRQTFYPRYGLEDTFPFFVWREVAQRPTAGPPAPRTRSVSWSHPTAPPCLQSPRRERPPRRGPPRWRPRSCPPPNPWEPLPVQKL
jgi:hypothetical protein